VFVSLGEESRWLRLLVVVVFLVSVSDRRLLLSVIPDGYNRRERITSQERERITSQEKARITSQERERITSQERERENN